MCPHRRPSTGVTVLPVEVLQVTMYPGVSHSLPSLLAGAGSASTVLARLKPLIPHSKPLRPGPVPQVPCPGSLWLEPEPLAPYPEPLRPYAGPHVLPLVQVELHWGVGAARPGPFLPLASPLHGPFPS